VERGAIMPGARKSQTGLLLLAAALCLIAARSSFACYQNTDGSPRFVLNGGEAFDTKTGLTWKRCSLGSNWDGQACSGEPELANLDDAMDMAKREGPHWRVPSGPELESIVDNSCGNPVVDQNVFPDIRPSDEGTAEYWTTNAVGAAELFYFFDFMSGAAGGHSPGFHLAVRLVRSGH
jgi:hypothetical protein